MREHLYKARRKDDGKWVEGSVLKLLTFDSYDGEEDRINYKDCYCIIPDDLTKFRCNDSILIDPETVCQFIGRTDINDKKVAEGDICNVWESRGADGRLRRKWDRPLTITYNDYLAKFGFDDRVFKEHWDITKFEAFEVIGNVHDRK